MLVMTYGPRPAHFIGQYGKPQAVLVALHRMQGTHSSEQIAEVLIDVLREYGFVGRLGVFVGDNAEANDVAWREASNVLHSQRDPEASRSRCLGHTVSSISLRRLSSLVRMSMPLRLWLR